MSKFDMEKKFRPLALIFIIVGVIGFLLFIKIITLIAMGGLAIPAWTLVCQNCGSLYIDEPVKFLISGHGDGHCAKCGHIN